MGSLALSYEDMIISTVLLPSTHMPSATLGVNRRDAAFCLIS